MTADPLFNNLIAMFQVGAYRNFDLIETLERLLSLTLLRVDLGILRIDIGVL